jgi:hypothetical protein
MLYKYGFIRKKKFVAGILEQSEKGFQVFLQVSRERTTVTQQKRFESGFNPRFVSYAG